MLASGPRPTMSYGQKQLRRAGGMLRKPVGSARSFATAGMAVFGKWELSLLSICSFYVLMPYVRYPWSRRDPEPDQHPLQPHAQ